MAVIDMLRAQRQVVKHRRRRRPAPPQEPRRARLRYRKGMMRWLDDAEAVIREELDPAIREVVERREDVRTDAMPPRIMDALRKARERLRRMVAAGELAGLLGRVGREVDTFSANDMRRVLGIDLREQELGPYIEQFVEENRLLIKSMAEQQAREAAEVLESAIPDGLRVEEIATRLQERFGVVRSRAELIARTETMKLKSQLDEQRQRAVGVTHYFWRDSNDERVRHRHGELDGNRFSYDSPPVAERDGTRHHPGRFPNCRCRAEPDTRGLLEAAA